MEHHNKIYEISWVKADEKEWVSAPSLIAALKTYCSVTSFHFYDFEDADTIVEIPKEDWSKYTITNTEYDPEDPNDKKEMTFDEWMNDNSQPDLIAGTMYGD